MALSVKQIVTDVVTVGSAISAVLAIVLNVSGAVSLPAPDIAIIVSVSAIVAAIVNALKPFAVSTVKKVRYFMRGGS